MRSTVQDNNLNTDEQIAEDNGKPDYTSSRSKKITSQSVDFTIELLALKKRNLELDPSPSWQRNYVYDRYKASKLIESVLMNVPLPAIYLAEEQDGTLSVIDGQQRLSTFFFFMDETFPLNDGTFMEFQLCGLEVLQELNKKKFSGLEKEQQLKIRNAPIHAIIIKNNADEDIKFDIFERLNTGAIKLNEDEIRNSVYRGTYIELLDELSKDEVFHRIVHKEDLKKRMRYRGMILRFFAIMNKSIYLYRPSMKQYCNKELIENRFMSETKAEDYKKLFRQSVDLCQSVFGENSFRRFIVGKESEKDGYWAIGNINLPLFDIQMCGFAMLDKDKFHNHYDEIREKMIDFMCNDTEFIKSIELDTSSTENVQLRFNKWLDALSSITKGAVSNPRNFPFSIKKQLFDADKTCKLCGNQILMIEDAEVDHIVPYSKGGDTTIDNAQLAHRYCNRKKHNNDN